MVQGGVGMCETHTRSVEKTVNITERIVSTEFGSYVERSNYGYVVHTGYNHISAYEDPSDRLGEWLECPACKLTPKVWTFDNGRQTACGCWNNTYDHFTVKAESITSVYTRTSSSVEYDSDALRKHWNEYCQSGIVPCNHEMLRAEGKW